MLFRLFLLLQLAEHILQRLRQGQAQTARVFQYGNAFIGDIEHAHGAAHRPVCGGHKLVQHGGKGHKDKDAKGLLLKKYDF